MVLPLAIPFAAKATPSNNPIYATIEQVQIRNSQLGK